MTSERQRCDDVFAVVVCDFDAGVWRCGDVARLLGVGLFMFSAGCSDDAVPSVEEISNREQSSIYSPGETWDSPSAFKHDPAYWAGTEYAKSVGALYAFDGTGKMFECSASVIGESKIVSAHHCLPPKIAGLEQVYTFTPSTFVNSVKSSSVVVDEALMSMGFRGTALELARTVIRREALSDRRGE